MIETDACRERKQPQRPHFIKEWAADKGATQADISRAIGADKSNLSHWFKGTTPTEVWQEKLAEYFETTRDGLFRHPVEDWFIKFFAGRSREEIARMKSSLEGGFPRHQGNNQTLATTSSPDTPANTRAPDVARFLATLTKREQRVAYEILQKSLGKEELPLDQSDTPVSKTKSGKSPKPEK